MPINWETKWRFETAQFVILARITEDSEPDLSWDETGEVSAKLQTGEFVCFGVAVSVLYQGKVIASDSLWSCIYDNADEFFTAHRDADPMNRNSSIMRAANGGNSVICHYFPDMVTNVTKQAREKLAQSKRDLAALYLRSAA